MVTAGDVRADLVERLLRGRPKVIGVAVPGMPVGSPGMALLDAPTERYEVRLDWQDGGVRETVTPTVLRLAVGPGRAWARRR